VKCSIRETWRISVSEEHGSRHEMGEAEAEKHSMEGSEETVRTGPNE